MMKNLLNLTNRYYAALINLVLNYIFVSMIVKVICGKKKENINNSSNSFLVLHYCTHIYLLFILYSVGLHKTHGAVLRQEPYSIRLSYKLCYRCIL